MGLWGAMNVIGNVANSAANRVSNAAKAYKKDKAYEDKQKEEMRAEIRNNPFSAKVAEYMRANILHFENGYKERFNQAGDIFIAVKPEGIVLSQGILPTQGGNALKTISWFDIAKYHKLPTVPDVYMTLGQGPAGKAGASELQSMISGNLYGIDWLIAEPGVIRKRA